MCIECLYFFPHFLYLLGCQGIWENNTGRVGGFYCAWSAGKAWLSQRITCFSCEIKGTYSPVCLGPSLDSWWLQTLAWATELLRASNRVGGTLTWVLSDRRCASEHQTLAFLGLSVWGWPWVRQAEVHSLFLCCRMTVGLDRQVRLCECLGEGEIPNHDSSGQMNSGESPVGFRGQKIRVLKGKGFFSRQSRDSVPRKVGGEACCHSSSRSSSPKEQS